jgi:hypothetical protein
LVTGLFQHFPRKYYSKKQRSGIIRNYTKLDNPKQLKPVKCDPSQKASSENLNNKSCIEPNLKARFTSLSLKKQL